MTLTCLVLSSGVVHLEALELLSTECTSKVGMCFLDNWLPWPCANVYVQVMTEQEAMMDDKREKLNELLANLNEAFTLSDVEEGMLLVEYMRVLHLKVTSKNLLALLLLHMDDIT